MGVGDSRGSKASVFSEFWCLGFGMRGFELRVRMRGFGLRVGGSKSSRIWGEGDWEAQGWVLGVWGRGMGSWGLGFGAQGRVGKAGKETPSAA